MKIRFPSKNFMIHGDLHVINAHQLRRMLVIALSAMVVATILAFGAGILAARHLGQAGPAVTGIEKIVHDPEKEKFAIAKLGELSGRLSRLETDAAYLVKRVGFHEEIARKLGAIDPQLRPGDDAPAPSRKSARPQGQGGVLLPPRGDCHTALPTRIGSITLKQIEQMESSLGCLQQLFSKMDDSVSSRNANLMAIPSQQPIEDASIGSPFGNRTDPFTGHIAFHSGLDFAAETTTPIYAAAGGRVIGAGPHGAYGNMVQIDHGNGLVTRYAHTSKIHVNEGDVVMPHQLIAAVGSTGRSTGPHLHFEVMYQGEFVDPRIFLSLGQMEIAENAQALD